MSSRRSVRPASLLKTALLLLLWLLRYCFEHAVAHGVKTGPSLRAFSRRRSLQSAQHFIPGVIEAEWFDEGGQGVAYSDTTTGNSGDDVRDETFVVHLPFGTMYNTSARILVRTA